MSRNKREGFYFGKAINWDSYRSKNLGNGYDVITYNQKKHHRTLNYSISLKGYFKGMNK